MSLKTKDLFFLKFHDWCVFAPLLLTKLFCDVINRERGREGAEKTRFLGNFLPLSDVDSDLTTLGIAEQDCANFRGKGFSDKKAFICKI